MKRTKKESTSVVNEKSVSSSLIEEAKKDDNYNPWTDSNIKSSTKKNKDCINVNEAVSQLVKQQDNNSLEKKKSESSKTTKTETISTLTQEELIHRAFATAKNSEIENEFEKEKKEFHEENDPTKKEEKIVRGWGTWCGEG